MLDDVTRSPLCWPHWKPRTKWQERKFGRFGTKGDRWGVKEITLAQARNRLFDELGKFTKSGHAWRCDPSDVIISTDLALRNDGLPRSGQKKPDDPGVAVYFELDSKPRCIPCDQYNRIEDNLAAIAATVAALRTIERHGSQMFEAAFSGFDALPSPDFTVGRSWRDVLNYYGDDLAECKRQYRRAAKDAHPDAGGNDAAFSEVGEAWEQAQEALGGVNHG